MIVRSLTTLLRAYDISDWSNWHIGEENLLVDFIDDSFEVEPETLPAPPACLEDAAWEYPVRALKALASRLNLKFKDVVKSMALAEERER